jgi:Peptidase A4 family
MPHRTLIAGLSLVLAWTPTAASGTRAPSHSDRTALITRGWAGYLVRAGAGRFSKVRGTWVQPHVVCNRPGSSAAFWIGLGGTTPTSNALEQIGTSADCSERALVWHSAWYQLYPAPAVELPLVVRPGDTISASVAVGPGTVTLAVRDFTTGAAFSAQPPMSSAETDSAEWIVEAPASCLRTCAQLALAAFDRVHFAGITATSGAHTGTIRDPAWTSEQLQMATRNRTTRAIPTPLSADGSSFSVIG